ncbi:MAG TPA: hypothetical protein VFS40_11670 [Gemmatimonadales bacterium]|nr:hypothetical protein [Gemmatimonadales bacterium]
MAAPTSPQVPMPAGGITPEKLALAEAVARVREDDQARRAAGAAAPPPRRSSPVLLGVLLLLAAGGGWILAARPAWLFPPVAVVESPEVREASLRMTMFVMARRLGGYRTARGVWPDSLREVATPPATLRYSRTGEGWRLEGHDGALHLTLTHTDSLPLFVGTSYQVLARRSGR